MSSSVVVSAITPNIKIQGEKQICFFDEINQVTTFNLQNEFDYLTEDDMPSKNNFVLSLKSGEAFKWTVSQKKLNNVEQRAEYTFSYYRPDTIGHEYNPLVIANVTLTDLGSSNHDGTIFFTLPINMGGRVITNLHAPINTFDAVNKDYVDTQIANIQISPPDLSELPTQVENIVNDAINTREQTINPVAGNLFAVYQISLPRSIDITWVMTGCQKGFVLWKPTRILSDMDNPPPSLNPSSYYIYYSSDGLSWESVDLLRQNSFVTIVADGIHSYARATYIYMFTDGVDFYCFVKQNKDNELYETDGTGKINGAVFALDTDLLELNKPAFNLLTDVKLNNPSNKYATNGAISLSLIVLSTSESAILKHNLMNSTWSTHSLPENNVYNVFYNKTNYLFYAIGQNRTYYSSDGETWNIATIGSDNTPVAGNTQAGSACITDSGTILIPKNSYFRPSLGIETLPSSIFSSLNSSAFFYAGNNIIGMLAKTPDDNQTATPGKHYVYLSRDEGCTWMKCEWLANETSNIGRVVTSQPINGRYSSIVYNNGTSSTDRAYVINFEHIATIYE